MYPIVCGSLSEVGRNIKLEVYQEPVQDFWCSIGIKAIVVICNYVNWMRPYNNGS